MIKKLKNFIAKLFGIKQCQCKDEHLELYEDVSEPDIPKQLLTEASKEILSGLEGIDLSIPLTIFFSLS